VQVHEDVYGRRAVDAVRARLPQRVWVQASAPSYGEAPVGTAAR
jgi:hypothetical protein